MRLTYKHLFLVIGLVTISPLAFGYTPDSGPREACKTDVDQFCHGTQSDPQQARDCLESHYKEISDGCYSALKEAASAEDNNEGPGQPPPDDQQSGIQPPPPDDQGAAGSGDPRQACKADVQRLCKGIQPGGGRLVSCLKDNSDQLSDSCASALQSLHARGGGGGRRFGRGGGGGASGDQ